jgi:hypothetical protein
MGVSWWEIASCLQSIRSWKTLLASWVRGWHATILPRHWSIKLRVRIHLGRSCHSYCKQYIKIMISMRTRLSLAHEYINSWYSYNDTIEKIWVPVQKMKGNPCRSEVALNTSQNRPRAHWYPNHRISELVHVRSIFTDWCDPVVSSKSLALPMISEKIKIEFQDISRDDVGWWGP